MVKKQAGWISLIAGLALLGASCNGGSGGGGGGGSMYVLTCTLGCTNGVGGAQVSCGIVNTFENQDIGILFSDPVNFGSINASTFQIFDTNSAAVPPGRFQVDPNNVNRLLFSPKLSFDPDGNPIFGFVQDASYQIRLPGRAQGDLPPFIESTGGKENESRLQCTITTSEGFVDPVPGQPIASLFVSTKDPNTGLITNGVPASGATNVASSSKITIVFNDLMYIGTVVIPSSGQAPFIKIQLDTDGNLNDPTDRVPLAGTWTFNVNQFTLQTTAVFTPSGGLPSLGSDPLKPRTVVVTLLSSIRDLSGKTLFNPGETTFRPERIFFNPVTLPPGGEQFTDVANADLKRSGADWGESQGGRLKPGLGGGSGRLGDLEVKTGTTTLYTSPVPAVGKVELVRNPVPADQGVITINGFGVVFKKNVQQPFESKIHPFLSYTLQALVEYCNSSADPLLTPFSYSLENDFVFVITSKTPGTTHNGVALDLQWNTGNVLGTVLTPTMTGGVDSLTYDQSLITNFDFMANPGGTPAPIAIDDGVFEFSSVRIDPGATVRVMGDNPLRLLASGQFLLADTGRIDLSGQSMGPHESDGPLGQFGGFGGPAAGAGGNGADRFDNTGSDLLGLSTSPDYDAGIEYFTFVPVIDGSPGEGVGGGAAQAEGQGGVHYPATPPDQVQSFNQFETTAPPGCVSEQVGGAGSGGGYALDGGVGTATATNPVSSQGNPNTPGTTAGGDSSQLTLNATTRMLHPSAGNLRGGSGGGGGGAHITDTMSTVGNNGTCTDPAAAVGSFIVVYRSHSGAAGGGGGGAGQFQGGRGLQVDGVIDATGGDGGSADPAALVTGLHATPGGGAAGGAVLLQSKIVDLAPVVGRVNISGGAGGGGVTGSTGGDGSAGLVRLEDLTNQQASVVAASITPVDPNDPDPLLSVGAWVTENTVPESFSTAFSCWMNPTGNFFSLTFDDDDFSGPTPVWGWNMDLILQIGMNQVTAAYRGSTVFGGNDPQTHWGDLLNRDLAMGETGAPILVRFQGAKSTGMIAAPCDVDVNDPFGDVVQGSLTPWVRHPRELNDFSPPPDMMRFVIIFDASHVDFGSILGVTNLRVNATPD